MTRTPRFRKRAATSNESSTDRSTMTRISAGRTAIVGNSGAGTLTYTNAQTPPTLFLNSSVERMHAGREDYRAKLAPFGIYTEVHDFPDSPHGFCLFEPWFTPTVQYVDAFLKKVF